MYKQSQDRLYLFRKCGEKTDATKMMFMTEFENELENDFDIEETMDGSYTSDGSLENTLSATAKANYDDPLCDEFEDAVRDKIAYEVWEVESQIEGEKADKGKFKAKYHQGRFKNSNAKVRQDLWKNTKSNLQYTININVDMLLFLLKSKEIS